VETGELSGRSGICRRFRRSFVTTSEAFRGIPKGELMNEKPKKWKLILVGLMAGTLIGGTVAVTTPSVAAGPAKVWKQIKKKADKRDYTKAKSNKRYAKKPTVIRGNFGHTTQADGASDFVASGISFGVKLPGVPTDHYIPVGGVVPAGCSGNVNQPSADAGHLCVFEGFRDNIGAGQLTSGDGTGPVDQSGALVYAYSVAAGQATAYGTWALGVEPGAVYAKLTTKNSGRPAGK